MSGRGAGTKRRRASLKATPAVVVTASVGEGIAPKRRAAPTTIAGTSHTHGTTTNYVWTIYRTLLELSSTPELSAATFQALADVKWTGSSSAPSPASATIATASAVGFSSSPSSSTTILSPSSSLAGYWMIVATSTLQRLIQEQKEMSIAATTAATTTSTSTKAGTMPASPSTSELSNVIALLVDVMSRIVVTTERSKLEKALQATASRATVARALLVPTLGAIQCLCHLLNEHDDSTTTTTAAPTDEDGNCKNSVLLHATVALDRLIHLQASPPHPYNAMATLMAAQAINDNKNTDVTPTNLQEVCAMVSTDAIEDQVVQSLLFLSTHAASSPTNRSSPSHAGEAALTTAPSTPASSMSSTMLLMASSSSSSSPPKRGRTRRQSAFSIPVVVPNSSTATTVAPPDTASTTSTTTMVRSELLPLMKTLLGPLVDQRMDARVAVKRWSSIALVWYNQAPLKLLQLVHQLASKAAEVAKTTPLDDKEEGDGGDKQSKVTDMTSRVIYRLLAIVAESGATSGFRPPTGAMDQYLTQLAHSREVARVDIRDWTVVASYDMIQIHRQGLIQWKKHVATTSSSSSSSSSSRQRVMVNDDDDADDETHHECFAAPNLSVILASLCRSVSHSVASAGYSQQSEWSRALSSIVASFCIQLASELTVPLDVMLCTWALSQLTSSLRSLREQSSSASAAAATTTTAALQSTNDAEMINAEEGMMEQYHQLFLEIPKPWVPNADVVGLSSKTGGGAAKKTTYAHVWTVRPTFTNEDAMAILLRGLISDGVENVRMQLFSFLTDVIRRCYSARTQDEQHRGDFKSKTKGGRKRVTKPATAGRATKQRKMTKDQTPSKVEDEDQGYRQISPARAYLAKEALTVLKLALASRRESSSVGEFGLVDTIRDELSISQVKGLIELGTLLDDVLFKSRTSVSRRASLDAQTSDTPPVLESTSIPADELAVHEKALWSAHIEMCEVLARGHEEYDGEGQLLFTEADRKAIFESIAGSKTSPWPLTLPCAHHAFLIANVTCMSPGPEQSAPELFLVKHLVKAIKERLLNLPYIDETSEPTSDSNHAEERPALSYDDAVLAILAFSRLSSESQRRAFEDLCSAILTSLQKFGPDSLSSNTIASSFLARTIVLSCAMISIQTYGQPLSQVIFASYGQSRITLPELNQRAPNMSSGRCFAGLLGNWESPGLPDFDRSSPTVPMKEVLLHQMQSLLETAFRIGIRITDRDNGYLLFTAWNGLGKLCIEAGAEKLKTNTISLQISSDDYPRRILQIRDDVCSIQSEVHRIAAGARTLTAIRFRSNLKSTLHRANILMGRLLDDAVGAPELDASLVLLLASIPTYVASSIAAHTTPGNDYFSNVLGKGSGRRRNRGYSSESERLNSDVDSSVDTDAPDNDTLTVDAINRLRDCCDAFGAAPTHPDWLDSSCRFQEGVSSSDAVDNAETALRLLNKLARTALEQYHHNLLESLKAYGMGNPGATDEEMKLCLDLLPFTLHGESDDSVLGPGAYYDDRDWKDDISTLFDFPPGFLDHIMDATFCTNAATTRDSFAHHSGHRVCGCLQDKKRIFGGCEFTTHELRAGGEWDILLAEALATSCLDVKRYSQEHPEADLETFPSDVDMTDSSTLTDSMLEGGYKYLKKARMWHSVLSAAVNNMPPAASLLRMGISKVGRSSHPFSLRENVDNPWDAVPVNFNEEIAGNMFSSDLVALTVGEVLVTISRVAAQSDDSIAASCQAVAAQLVVDSQTFEDMESMQCIRLALNALRSSVDHSGKALERLSSLDVLPFIIERLLLTIEEHGRKGLDAVDGYGILRTMFRLNHYSINTVIATPVDVFSILKFDELNTSLWINALDMEKATRHLVAVTCGSPFKATDRGRAAAALLLEKLISSEWYHSEDGQEVPRAYRLLELVSSSFEAIPKSNLKDALLCDLCDLGHTKSVFRVHSSSLARLLIFLLGGNPNFKHARYIHDTLVDSLASWARLPTCDAESTECAMDVLLTLGCQFNTLTVIGSRMLECTGTEDKSGISLQFVATFFDFMKNLTEGKANWENPPSSIAQGEGNGDQSYNGRRLAHRCSFVEKTGYHGQHWYNCYTCGLVWEKGCCTICALVCHDGHDVSYSRYSSFFCDCAAEDGTATTQNRVSCQCMVSIPANKIEQLELSQMAEINVQIKKPDKNNACLPRNPTYPSLSVEVAITRYGEESQKALVDFPKSLSKKVWFDSLVKLFHEEVERWKTSKNSIPLLQTLQLPGIPEALTSTMSTYRVPMGVLRSLLRERSEKPLQASCLQKSPLIPIRSVNGFQTKMSADTSSNAQLQTRFSREDLSHCNIVVDSRGRLIVAEPHSLVFCGTIQAISNRYVGKSIESPLSREQMCILGNAAVPFNVIGMKLCPENERHLVLWSLSAACVVVITPYWDGTEKKIDLSIDLEPDDVEATHLVKCEFVPGSQTSVVVGYGHKVRVYDITGCGDNRANTIVAFNLGFESALKDLSFVALSERPWSGSRPLEMEAKMFMLLEDGKLLSINLKINADGRVDSPIGQPCELSESVLLPSSGVSLSSGSPLGGAGDISKSFGDGSNIVFLKQSRVLLYKCVSSCVLALMLDADGNVKGSFELLPHLLSPDTRPHDDNEHSIVGPYNHWTELGPYYGEDGTFFRVACIGRSSRTNQPKLLCVDFNQSDVRFNEIRWALPNNVESTLGLSVEGLCSFSMPCLGDDFTDRKTFGERSFLCASTSSGSLMFFGEATVDVVSDKSNQLELVSLDQESGQKAKEPKFPLTIFEQLLNVTECEELHFCGEGTGCDSADLKSKLLRDRSSTLVCNRREGCALSISLRPPSEHVTKSKTSLGRAHGHENLSTTHAIVAFRVLVGSNLGNIPTTIIVQGRPVDLSPRVKKWYSLPLTNEEIILGMRCGFVTLGIGPASEHTSSSVVDAVEVYARERKDISPWVQKFYFGSLVDENKQSGTAQSSLVAQSKWHLDNRSTCGLLLGAKALSSFCELSPDSVGHIDKEQRRRVQSIVEETAYTQDAAVSQAIRDLICRLEPHDVDRGSLFDESLLRGWLKALVDLRLALPKSPWEGADGKTRWTAVQRFLVKCLEAVSKIARDRPMIYLRCMDVFAISNPSVGSIALQVLQYVCDACRLSLPCLDILDGANGVVSLCLTEAATGIRLNTERGRRLAGFDDIMALVKSGTLDLTRSVCRAISGFCQRAGDPEEDESNIFRTLQAARLVAYQCDSCGLCPVKDVRYTCLEESFDIDLCHLCFTRATEFAQANDFKSSIDILVDERAIGIDTKLTCADVERMEAVPVEKLDVAQLDPVSDSAMNENGELQMTVRPRLGESRSENNEPRVEAEAQPYDDFLSVFFSSMVCMISAQLAKGERSHQLAPMLRVCLDLIRDTTQTEAKVDRARQLTKEISSWISSSLQRMQNPEETVCEEALWSVISCLRAGQLLLLPSVADHSSLLEKIRGDEASKSNVNPDVLCDTHQIPAVRRRSAKGKNKDRRFYVCGKERGQRCAFFKWADELDLKHKMKIKISSQLKNVVLENLWGDNLMGKIPLNALLCRFLESELFEKRKSLEETSDHSYRIEKRARDPLASRYNEVCLQRDVEDGVICSREKLQDDVRGHIHSQDPSQNDGLSLDKFGKGGVKRYLLEASLELLALVADYKTPGITRWFSLLCEIENSASFSESRDLARNVLKSLCGKKRVLFHCVRDHFSFGFQFQALFRNAAPLLETALIVSEKARVCGSDWAASCKLDWHSLSFGGLIGCDVLISENDYPEPRLRSIGLILDDIYGLARNGTESWRRFCGHATLPPFHRDHARTSPDLVFAEKMTAIPPIVVLFWVACSLSGDSQVKAFRLIDMALTNTPGGMGIALNNGDGKNDAHDDSDMMLAISGSSSSAPELLLLSTAKRLTVEDMTMFVLNFVLDGESSELRRACYIFASRIAATMSRSDRTQLFTKLLSSKFLGFGEYGKSNTEFLNYLQCLTSDLDSSSSIEEYGDLLLCSFINQMEAARYNRSGDKLAVIEGSPWHSPMARPTLGLEECLHCFRTKFATGQRDKSDESLSLLSAVQSKRVGSARPGRQMKKWRPEQVSAFSRQRIDYIRAGSSSNEFNTFYTLKHRVVIGDIFLTVADPRGRFVKGITIYYSPYPAKDAAELKLDEYSPKWQKCVSMVLPRGTTRATATLTHSVVAANLRIEYTEFYERPGGSKASDGSLLVHCPRCTRVVTNAHGVCGNCGEVAFQCRKCRHINYDRLDAFLCVECGYCASGSFSLEINAAIASNAIAIVSDKEHSRAMNILGAVNTLHDAVKVALSEKMVDIDKQNEASNALSEARNFDATMESALLGLPPVLEASKTAAVGFMDRIEKPGSLVRIAARPESLQDGGRSADSPGDRTQSLLRLARQIRSESGGAWDRRRSGDLLIRHLGRGIALETVEGQRNLIGLLEDGNILESADSLGRAIAGARASARGDRLAALGRPERPSEEATGDAMAMEQHHSRKGKKLSAKETLDECQRLHSLIREAQLERYELKRRIHAWEMLNEGSLVDTGHQILDDDEIDTCRCSICGPTVALSLLSLWAHLFAAHPSQVRVDVEFLNLLLTDSAVVGKNLSDRMRDTITEIATKSEDGARLVLTQIRRRLLATEDPVSAEILGKIMTVEGHYLPDEYAKLAMDLLSQRL